MLKCYQFVRGTSGLFESAFCGCHKLQRALCLDVFFKNRLYSSMLIFRLSLTTMKLRVCGFIGHFLAMSGRPDSRYWQKSSRIPQ